MPLLLNSARFSWARVVFAAFCAAFASLPTAGFGQPGKLKQPEQATVAKEVAVVKSTFEREIQEAANDESAATKLVYELLSKVSATPDAEGKWALLKVAQEIAEEASGSIDAALKCVTARAALFDIDLAKERNAVLKEFSKPKPPANAQLFGKAMEASREALASEKFPEAREAAEIAADVAKALLREENDRARQIRKESKGKVKPPAPEAEDNFVLPAARLVKKILEAESLSNASRAAESVLRTSPDDMAAQASVGEYKCFLKAAWADGLPLMAKNRNSTAADIAAAELRARDPVDMTKLLEVADKWWELAKTGLKDSEVKREAIQRHAADIYALVLPNLKKPLDVKRAEDRVTEVGHQPRPPQQRQGELQAVFLSRLKEKDFRVVHHGFGRGLHENTPIYSLSDGKLSPHGLSMHPGGGQDISYVRYELPAGVRRFRSTVSLDRSGSWDHCGIGFELLADGKSIWKSPKIHRGHQSDTCDVEIRNCRTLELRTLDMGGVFGGHAVWIEPQIYVDPVAWTGQIPIPAFDPNDNRRGQIEKQVLGTWKDSNGYIWRFKGDGTVSIDGLGGGVWELLQDGRILANRSHGTANELISITSPEKIVWPDGGSLTKLSSDTTFTAAETNFEANREAAGWVLRLKGSVDIEVPGGKRERIEAVDKLPAGQFVVVSINLPPNAGVKAGDLKALKPLDRLENLGFGGNPIADDLFDHIGDLPNLRGMGVNWTGVTGAGLARLRNARLVGIDAGGVKNIMPALQRFKAMQSLESINFDRVDIPKEGFEIIAEMKTLKQLWFRKGFISDDNLNYLKQQLPSCNITLHQ